MGCARPQESHEQRRARERGEITHSIEVVHYQIDQRNDQTATRQENISHPIRARVVEAADHTRFKRRITIAVNIAAIVVLVSIVVTVGILKKKSVLAIHKEIN